MNYKVAAVANFRREAKTLIKKYPSLKGELQDLNVLLCEQPQTGVPLGKHCYKIRISIASKGSGKSGGARIITHFHVAADTVYLLSIFDKSEKENITDKELQEILQSIR